MPRVAAPAPNISGDVIRIIVNVLADNEQCQWGIDYMSTGFSVNPATDLGLLQATFNTNYSAHIKNVLDPTCTFESTTAIFLSRSDVASQTLTTGFGIGTAGASHLPKEMSARFIKKSTLKGAHGRGGTSVGPVPNTFVTPATNPNVINAAALLAYAPLTNDFSLPIGPILGSGNTFTPCISTRPALGSSLVVKAQPILSVGIDTNLGTVKRRKPGRGI